MSAFGFRHLMIAAALSAAVAAPVAAAEPVETVVQDDALFLHASDKQVAAAMQRTRELGFDRVRLTAGWSVTAPQPQALVRPSFDAGDPAAYPKGAWNPLDRAVRAATAAGLKPLIDIAFWAPLWATKGDASEAERPRTEVDPAEFALFARAVARRYSGSYTPPADIPAPAAPSNAPPPRTVLDDLFGRPAPAPPSAPATDAPRSEPLPAVDLFTLWNEPNHAGFLRPQWTKVNGVWTVRSAEIYRAMVRAAYPQVKEVAPSSRVLVGGTAPMGSSDPGRDNVPPLRFLRALVCVDEKLKPVRTGTCAKFSRLPGDGWAHHPYSLRTTPNVDTEDRDKLPVAATARLAATLRELADSGRIAPDVADIYMTEYGYETNPPDTDAPFGLDEQPRLLAWAESIATEQPAVRMWPQFQLHDRPEDPTAVTRRRFHDWQSGLFDSMGAPKPAAAEWPRPVFAECDTRRGRRWVMVWGRLRGQSGVASVEVEERAGEAWIARASSRRPGRRRGTARAAVSSRPGAAVRRWVAYRPNAQYRLAWRGQGDVTRTTAVRPVGC